MSAGVRELGRARAEEMLRPPSLRTSTGVCHAYLHPSTTPALLNHLHLSSASGGGREIMNAPAPASEPPQAVLSFVTLVLEHIQQAFNA